MNAINRFLCWLGFHNWLEFSPDGHAIRRVCWHCPKTQTFRFQSDSFGYNKRFEWLNDDPKGEVT